MGGGARPLAVPAPGGLRGQGGPRRHPLGWHRVPHRRHPVAHQGLPAGCWAGPPPWDSGLPVVAAPRRVGAHPWGGPGADSPRADDA
eukprot:4121942-Alexandrium_andersonii.AAC.1